MPQESDIFPKYQKPLECTNLFSSLLGSSKLHEETWPPRLSPHKRLVSSPTYRQRNFPSPTDQSRAHSAEGSDIHSGREPPAPFTTSPHGPGPSQDDGAGRAPEKHQTRNPCSDTHFKIYMHVNVAWSLFFCFFL